MAELRICVEPGCSKEIYCKQVCKTHYHRDYMRILRGNLPKKIRTPKPKRERAHCSIDGCGRTVHVHKYGWCSIHYSRWQHTGDPLTPPQSVRGSAKVHVCTVEGCHKAARARGLCPMHSERLRRTGGLNDPEYKNSGACSVEGCNSKAKAKGWCTKHYKRWFKGGDPIQEPKKSQGGALKFALEIAPKYKGDECLLWPFARGVKGHGQITVKGVGHNASRVVCKAVHGEPPTKRHHAAHRCNVSACVNPDHLYWATPSENERDKLAVGRSNRGERCGTSKLTEEDVQHIRSMALGMPYRQIAPIFGVSDTTVRQICNRKLWAWLD